MGFGMAEEQPVLRGTANRNSALVLELIKGKRSRDPFQTPPPFHKLAGDLEGSYSRRINILHRLVYQVLEKERVVKVLRLWTHYE